MGPARRGRRYPAPMAGRVVRISIAPVKALGLVHPEAVALGRDGVAGDRRFWLVDGNGRLANNRRHGRLMQIRPTWDEDARTLRLDFPDGAVVAGVVELGGEVELELHHDPHPSRPVIGPWQDAISAYAGEPLQLFWSEAGAADRLAHGGAVSIVSRGSLERLRCELGVEEPVDGRRFRMLFEIDGVEAHAEDGWIGARVQLGEAAVDVGGDVGRCVITTMDPDRGTRDLDTLGALARYRREGRTEPLPFGVYGAVAVPGRVRVGDAVSASASALSPTAPA
jgi:MOSC domain-containing protein